MSLVPVTSVPIPFCGVGTTRSDFDTVMRVGSLWYDVVPLSFVDIGSAVVINGISFTPDLTQCLGPYADPEGYLAQFMPLKAATAFFREPVGDNSYRGQHMRLARFNQPRQAFLDNGQRLMPVVHQRSEEGYGDTATNIRNRAVVFDKNAAQGRSRANRTSRLSFGALRHLGEIFVLTSNEANNQPALERYSATDGTFLGFVDGTQGALGANWWWPNGPVLVCPDGVVTAMTSVTQSYTLYNGFTKTTLHRKDVPLKVNQDSSVRNIFIKDGDSSMYVLVLYPATNNRYISRVTVGSATLSDFVETTTTADMAPFADWAIPSASTGEPGYGRFMTGEIVTVAGERYLVLVSHSGSMYDTRYDKTQVVAYKIGADKNQLTLVMSKTYGRTHGVLFNGSKLYFMTSSGVWLKEFIGTDLLDTETFEIPVSCYLILTEQGTVLAYSPTVSRMYNLSLGQSSIVNVRFAKGSVVYGQETSADLLVDVTDGAGARQAKSVALTISGGTFDGGATDLTVNTLTTGTLTVPVTITAPGAVTVTPRLL